MARRRSGMLSPSVLIRRNAIYRGFFGGSRGWLVVGVVMFGGKALRRVLGRSEELVANEVLKPGQFIRIEAIRPTTRGERRVAKRVA